MEQRWAFAGLLIAVVAMAATPAADARDLFDMLFGGFSRHAPAPPPSEPGGPLTPLSPNAAPSLGNGPRDERVRGAQSGTRTAFCVRSCDGRYFPVTSHAGFSAAQMCHSFCPASETLLYFGGSIDHAVDSNGRAYSALPNAYAYRKMVVTGCTCNGRSPFGLARIDAQSDPTLRKGDVLATRDGLVSVTDKTGGTAEFSPIAEDHNLPNSEQQKLAGAKVRQSVPSASAQRDKQVSGIRPRSTTGSGSSE